MGVAVAPVERVVAIAPYVAQNPDEMTLRKGQLITVRPEGPSGSLLADFEVSFRGRRNKNTIVKTSRNGLP